VTCRLLYLVGSLVLGGLERQLVLLLQAMDRTRYRPAVAVWDFDGADPFVRAVRALDVPLHAVPRRATRLGRLAAFRRLAAQLRPEVIHSFSFFTNVAAWAAAPGAGAIAVGSVQSDFVHDQRSTGRVLGPLCARWPRDQIFNSASAAARARRAGGPFAPARAFVVRNAVDPVRFAPAAPADAARARLLGVGALASTKRWDRFVDAVGALVHSGCDVEATIVGEGPLRPLLERRARARGIADRVRLLGAVADDACLARLYADATLLVHTGDVEGTPNVVLEAMACARPVVAADTGDVSALVEDGTTGFVVPGDDATALRDRIGTLLADRPLCRRMGGAGRARAEREFAPGRLVAGTLAAYRAAGWRPGPGAEAPAP